MNTEQANRYLDGFQINDRSIYDSQDNEHPLDCLLEDYHQEQLKLLGISSVVKSLCEHHWVNANRYLDGFQINDRSIYDSQDNEHPLDCLLEDYHQEQLKLLG